MRKVAIISIYDNTNIGNRLQSYALYQFLRKMGIRSEQIKNNISFRQIIKKVVSLFYKTPSTTRYKNFLDFNKNIEFSKYIINKKHINKNIVKYYSFFIAGSDQIWNPQFAGYDYMFLNFVKNKEKKISYAASIGLSKIDDNYSNKIRTLLNSFNYISVREKEANEMVTQITGRNDIQTTIDPTLLLTKEDWEKVMRMPKFYNGEKFILLYFLGDLSGQRREQIYRLAKEKGCNVIEITNPDDPYYVCGPAEFLFLEYHAKFVFTDSFHSSVFSFLFGIPFVIYDRVDDNMENMNSRLDTLISTFRLKNRWYDGRSITENNLNANYTESYEILEQKRKESANFLKHALCMKYEN